MTKRKCAYSPATFRGILGIFGARVIGLRSPEVYPANGEKRTRFADVMERAPYQTKVTELDVIIECKTWTRAYSEP